MEARAREKSEEVVPGGVTGPDLFERTAKIGGGGGNRTRVRKHSIWSPYMLSPCFMSSRGRTRAPCPGTTPRMNLVRRRRGATPDQPTFLAELAGAIGWAPGSRAFRPL